MPSPETAQPATTLSWLKSRCRLVPAAWRFGKDDANEDEEMKSLYDFYRDFNGFHREMEYLDGDF